MRTIKEEEVDLSEYEDFGDALRGLGRFLDVPTRGLWRDWMDEGGGFVEEPAPASSFYHIVGAIAELERLTQGAAE